MENDDSSLTENYEATLVRELMDDVTYAYDQIIELDDNDKFLCELCGRNCYHVYFYVSYFVEYVKNPNTLYKLSLCNACYIYFRRVVQAKTDFTETPKVLPFNVRQARIIVRNNKLHKYDYLFPESSETEPDDNSSETTGRFMNWLNTGN